MAEIKNNVVANSPTQKGDYKPMIYLMTDGKATDDPTAAIARWQRDYQKRATLVTIGIGPFADLGALSTNSDHTLRLETQGFVDEDGTADFAEAKVSIYPRAHELEEDYAVDSAELRAFFYPRARAIVQELANNGEFWPAMRAARPQWFGGV